MKKWLKAALCVLLAILLIVGGYVAYVFIDYHRIGDMALTPSDGGTASVRTDTPYTVLSYNIGFGAYEDDYGFFMDGGTESRARSEERLTKNLSEISAFLTEQSPDFLLAQEVDIGSTRSYQVDERPYLTEALEDMSGVFCQNYDSPYLMYPLLRPHGASRSGLLTLSSAAITANAMDCLAAIRDGLKLRGIDPGTPIFVRYCRVGAGDAIGDVTGCELVCMLVGERPGLVTDKSMSAYITYRPRTGVSESARTVVSNIHAQGTPAVEAGAHIAGLIETILKKKVSGVGLHLEAGA